LSHQTDPNIQCNTAHPYQMPQMQPMGTQVNQPLIYNEQLWFQQGNNLNQNGVPTLGLAPVQRQSMSMNLPLVQELEWQQVHPMPEYQQIPQNQLSELDMAVPYMTGPVRNPHQSNHQCYQVSPSVISSTASTPVLSCFSTPVYNSNAYDYVNTQFLSSASSTPILCNNRYPDIPPLLNLNKSLQGDSFPRQISCNINTILAQSWCQAAAAPASGCPASSNTLMKQLWMTANSSMNELVENTKDVTRREEENIWLGSCNYIENCHDGGSNVFITWTGSNAELVWKLHNFKLEVREVFSTSDKKVRNVIFESHPNARKAFTMQHLIRLRIVPPKNSHRIWLRNPSPKFWVKFETKCRLVVRKGKAECHDIVGELLKGCSIFADQLKGHSIRVVCCEGSFMLPRGKIVEMKGVPNEANEKTSLGWISYRCKYTKESLVIRRSWNILNDYIYNE